MSASAITPAYRRELEAATRAKNASRSAPPPAPPNSRAHSPAACAPGAPAPAAAAPSDEPPPLYYSTDEEEDGLTGRCGAPFLCDLSDEEDCNPACPTAPLKPPLRTGEALRRRAAAVAKA